MSPKPQVERPEFDERATVLRSLCQGPPVTVEKIEEQLGTDALEMFGVDSAVQLYDLIKITAASLLDDPDAQAIRNALGLGTTGTENLTERRMRLLDEVDITLRALQSREVKGAELLARQMEVMQKLRPDVAEGIDLSGLAGELHGLKEQVNDLVRQNETLTSKLKDIMEFAYAMKLFAVSQLEWKRDYGADTPNNQLIASIVRYIDGVPDLQIEGVEREIWRLERKLFPLSSYEDKDDFERDLFQYIGLIKSGIENFEQKDLVIERGICIFDDRS